jgi:hypothetical protein
LKRLLSAFIFLGLTKKKKIKKKKKNKKREINNRNKETCNKGNLIMESRGHRVKSKKESTIKELLKINNFILGKLLKA